MTTDQAREHLADVWTAAQATTHDKAEFECMKRGFIAGHEWATKDSIATIERLEGELRYIDKRCEEQIQDRIRLGEALTLATRERDEAVANKNAEIELLVDLLKRGFAISNREGWEEGENKTEWQSIASDVIATYDRKYRQHGLRSIEDRIALEKQQAAEIDRLTQQRDAAVKVIERLPKTADGEPVTPNMKVYHRPWGSPNVEESVVNNFSTSDACYPDSDGTGVERRYSTREAALAAPEASPR